MSFTICTSADDIPTNKLFREGKQEHRTKRPLWYVEIEKPYNTGHLLEDLYKTIQLIEKEDKPWIIIPEKVIKKENGRFRLSCKDGYLEENCYRSWVQFDIDAEQPKANLLPLQARLEEALAGLPFLTTSNDAPSVGMVVQLSNKAGLKTYPDKLALRIYVELEEKNYTNQLVRHYLEPYSPFIDLHMFNRASVHLVQPPEVIGEIQREIDGPTCIYSPGKCLSLEGLKLRPEYKERKERADTFQTTLKGLGSFSPEGLEMEHWRELARQGHFEGNRNALHYKIIANAQWRNQNGRAVIEALLKEPTGPNTIMGETRGRAELEEALQAIEKTHRLHFLDYIEDNEFDHYLPDPGTPDLKNQKLPELLSLVEKNLREDRATALAIRSPHGSSKTTAILPMVKDTMTRAIGRPPRILYICTLRSIIRGTCKDLRIKCYIQEDGTIDKEFICRQDELGICLKSIHHLEGRTFDLVILDESEELAMWSTWDNNNHPLLLRFMANAKLSILQDADAGDLTYSLIDRASRYRETEKALLLNSASWIAQQHHKLILLQKEIQIYDEICDEVADGGFCFVHVDFADKQGKPALKSLEKAFNDYFGETIAKSFCDLTPRNELIELEKEKNTYIPKLYQEGIRIIIVSPKIQSGWRYTEEPLFTATYGVYRHNFIPAPMIVQRTQRGTKTSTHYVYVNPISTYTDIETLTDDLCEYVGEPIEYSIVGPNDEAMREGREIAIEATAKKQKMLDNVKLHLAIYWDSFGGALQFKESLQENAKTHRYFRSIIKDAKQEIREQEAEDFLANPEKLEALRLSFNQGFDGLEDKEIDDLRTPGDILEALELLNAERLHHETAREMLDLLLIDQDIIARDELIDSIVSAERGTGIGRYQLQQLIVAIDALVPTDIEGGFIGFLREPDAVMVIETEALADAEGIVKRYKDVLRAKLGGHIVATKGRADTTLKNIFEKVFLCEVSDHRSSNIPKVKAKHDLIAHYKNRGFIQNKKGTVRGDTRLCNEKLKERIKEAPEELSDIEEIYIEANRALITIRNKNVYVSRRSRLLDNLRADLRRRKVG